eukprot:CAMPEP_0175044334 /NCGR_PEP_ID=MMETSP0052_2-20121109/3741_1 /TAXON_ID=51329 ORGANISM="Polytomella parva, Strain SAG 63-3" /NCGR_SAMPLE_ID=MMETSP0052_2 /ASSEMBLY_ACC=CAM_ASM_000194 /LENGTH=270 /DNA_ID=CAMNT_0016307605 /DNA_START=246 /DNA_END=1055 /DNA_ORIENTATION=+
MSQTLLAILPAALSFVVSTTTAQDARILLNPPSTGSLGSMDNLSAPELHYPTPRSGTGRKTPFTHLPPFHRPFSNPPNHRSLDRYPDFPGGNRHLDLDLDDPPFFSPLPPQHSDHGMSQGENAFSNPTIRSERKSDPLNSLDQFFSNSVSASHPSSLPLPAFPGIQSNKATEADMIRASMDFGLSLSNLDSSSSAFQGPLTSRGGFGGGMVGSGISMGGGLDGGASGGLYNNHNNMRSSMDFFQSDFGGHIRTSMTNDPFKISSGNMEIR